MSGPVEAARGLLARAAAPHWEPGRTLVLSASAAVLERAEAQTGFDAALVLREPALALPIAAAAEAACPRARSERLARLLSSIDPLQRPAALLAAEPFLARIDSDWAAGLVVATVGADGALAHGIGLGIATRQRARGLQPAAWVTQAPGGSLLQRQFAADSLLAAAARGAPVDDKDERWPAALCAPDVLLDTEASAVLAALGLADPVRGLELADRLLQSHAPHALWQALEIVAAAAVRDGEGEAVRVLAHRRGFVAEQAVWTLVGARAGAIPPDEVASLACNLAPRIADELDPGRMSIAGLPLLAALAHAERVEQVAVHATAWGVTPHALAEECIAAGDGTAASSLAEVLQHDATLFVGGDDAENAPPGWWLDAGGDPALRRYATLEVLVLAGSLPWRCTPGSIADIADMGRA